MPVMAAPAAASATMKPSKHDRDLVGLERSLGFRSNRGISRQSNKDWLPIQAIVQGMKVIAKQFVELTTGEIRQSDELRQAVTNLFEEWAPTIWPPQDHPQPDWLEDPDLEKFEGRYPRRLYYTVPEDRETLRDLFYNLVVEKCCNYHSNQLQRQRTSQRQSLDYLEPLGGTPQKTEPGSAVEGDYDMGEPEAEPPKPLPNPPMGEARYEARSNPGDFAFRVWQDYGMPSSELAPPIKTTEPAQSSFSAPSWTPANVAHKESTQEPRHTQEPTPSAPSEAATSDRPDRPMRPKRKRPQPEEEMLPKKVSGDRKAKKPRWSQIIPFKVSPHHLARLANGDRIAPSMPTSPEDTPELEDDTFESTIDETQRRASHIDEDSPLSPRRPDTPEFQKPANDNNDDGSDTINVKSHAPTPNPEIKRSPDRSDEREARETRPSSGASVSPRQSFANSPSRPQSSHQVSDNATASKPASSHGENGTSKPPLAPLTAPVKEREPSFGQEMKWRPEHPQPPAQPALPPTNGLHGHPAPAQSSTIGTPQNGESHPPERELDSYGGTSRKPSQSAASGDASGQNFEWRPVQVPGQPLQKETQSPKPAPKQDPQAGHRRHLSLTEEILGPLKDAPSALEVFRKTPNLTADQLKEMKGIFLRYPNTRDDFNEFSIQVHNNRPEPAQNGRTAPAPMPPAKPTASAPQNVPSHGAAIPKFPPQHVLPSNGTGSSHPPGAHAPPPSKRIGNGDVEHILGDYASCPTVKHMIHPNLRRRDLRLIKRILHDIPESRTNLDILNREFEERDSREDQSPSSEKHDQRPRKTAPAAAPSPRMTPGHGNPFNAFESNQHARPQQQQQQHRHHPSTDAAEAERAQRYSIVRSPPTGEGARREEAPRHASGPNPGRQAHPQPPPGVGSFRPTGPPPHPPAEIPLPHPHQSPNPNAVNFVHHVQHPHGSFQRMPNGPMQPSPAPPHAVMPHPIGHQHPPPPGPPDMHYAASRPSPRQHEKDQQRHAMPIRSTSMQSEYDAQIQRQQSSASMSPTPGIPANNLENVTVEINWARDPIYKDYLSMEGGLLHCNSAHDFFGWIEAQMPDELHGGNGNGNRIKELKVKALTPLQGEDGPLMMRIRRDEGSGRVALKRLVKKLRSQPPDADVELEFLVAWE